MKIFCSYKCRKDSRPEAPVLRRRLDMDDSLLLKLVEEFVCETRSGGDPDPEAYAELYPQFAGRIREIFPALLMLEDAAAEVPEVRSQKTVTASRLPDRKDPLPPEDTDEDPS